MVGLHGKIEASRCVGHRVAGCGVIRLHESLEAPLAAKHLLEQMNVLAIELPVNAGIGAHDRARIGFFTVDSKAGNRFRAEYARR